jgi:hypothetical protein
MTTAATPGAVIQTLRHSQNFRNNATHISLNAPHVVKKRGSCPVRLSLPSPARQFSYPLIFNIPMVPPKQILPVVAIPFWFEQRSRFLVKFFKGGNSNLQQDVEG